MAIASRFRPTRTFDGHPGRAWDGRFFLSSGVDRKERPVMTRIVRVLCLLPLLLAAACSSGSASPTPAPGPRATASVAAPGVAAQTAAATVPAPATVAAGATGATAPAPAATRTAAATAIPTVAPATAAPTTAPSPTAPGPTWSAQPRRLPQPLLHLRPLRQRLTRRVCAWNCSSCPASSPRRST